MAKIKLDDFKQLKTIPYVLGDNRMLRVAGHAIAQPGERFFQYEDSSGNLLLVREQNLDSMRR